MCYAGSFQHKHHASSLSYCDIRITTLQHKYAIGILLGLCLIHMKEETFTRPPDGDVNQGWAVLAICWAFIACALVSTMLRVYVRLRITRNLGLDDYVAVVAMVRIRISNKNPWRTTTDRLFLVR